MKDEGLDGDKMGEGFLGRGFGLYKDRCGIFEDLLFVIEFVGESVGSKLGKLKRYLGVIL